QRERDGRLRFLRGRTLALRRWLRDRLRLLRLRWDCGSVLHPWGRRRVATRRWWRIAGRRRRWLLRHAAREQRDREHGDRIAARALCRAERLSNQSLNQCRIRSMKPPPQPGSTGSIALYGIGIVTGSPPQWGSVSAPVA